MPGPNRRSCGSAGEDLACDFLREKDYTIIDRNYYAGKTGELDIVARKGSLVVFAEVKTRNTDAFGGGIYSISQAKKRTLKKSAEHYLVKNSHLNTREMTFRFDLILVHGGTVECVEDILR